MVVVGAGLGGLAAAKVVVAADRSVLVLEASDGVGGRVRTDEVDGFLLDRGFQVVLTAYPELHRQLDVAALDLRAFEPGALVWRNGSASVLGDPFRRPRTVVSTALAPVGSLLDKARIARLRYRLRRAKPAELLRGEDVTTLEALRADGFSEQIVERFFRPLFSGIQLDPTLSTSRRMFDVIFRSLAAGDSAVPAAGMGAIPGQLEGALPSGAVVACTPVATVAAGRVRTTAGDEVAAAAVVVATDGPAAAGLLRLPAVGSRPVGCVYFAADHAPTDSKLVCLAADGAGLVANVAVMSNIAPTYAPAGRHLVVAALPGTTDGDLEAEARRQLSAWWGDQVDAWRHLRTYRIPHGQPDQAPPFDPKQRVSLGEGLFVCGDHRDTGSIQGALYSGRRCGEAVVASLG